MRTSGPIAAGAPRNSRQRSSLAAATLAAATLFGSALEAYAQNCRPRSPRPPTPLASMGPCEFNRETFSFAGEPAEQVKCLMRAADRTRNLGPQLGSVPATLAARVGQDIGLPERDALSVHLVEAGLAWDFASFLWLPLSRAKDNDSEAPQARYFVIHDTSAPFIGWAPFPADIDTNEKINNLARFACKDDWAIAHVFINRMGGMLLGRELSEPWRATKFERGAPFGTDLRGLFLHIEMIQPRGVASHIRGRNDARAPDPGFSAKQYERLALLYVIASVRGGRWMIPAFHAALDSGIRGGHDDPQNFDIGAFATHIDRLVEQLAPGATAIAVAAAAERRIATAQAAATPTTAATDATSTVAAAPAATAPETPASPSATSTAATAIAATAAPPETTASVTAPVAETPAVVVSSNGATEPNALPETAPSSVAPSATTEETPTPVRVAHAPAAEVIPLPVPRTGPPAEPPARESHAKQDDHAQQKASWHKLNWPQKNAWWKEHNRRGNNAGNQRHRGQGSKQASRPTAWKAKNRWGRYARR